MKPNLFYKYLIISLALIFKTYGQDIPKPLLKSAEMHWFAHPLHVSMAYFDIGKLTRKHFRNMHKKNRAFSKYKRKENEIIQTTLDLGKSFKEKLEILNNDIYELLGLDIIGTHPEFKNKSVLQISSDLKAKHDWSKFKKIVDNGEAFETQLVPSRNGAITVPKYRWYLVMRLTNNIFALRSSVLHYFQKFNSFILTKYGYLPHISLGQIKSINNLDKFIASIENTNGLFFKEPKENKQIAFSQLSIIPVKYVFPRYPAKNYYSQVKKINPEQSDKFYLTIDKSKSFALLLELLIGWQTPVAKTIKKMVEALAQSDKQIKEKESSFSSILHSAENKIHNIFLPDKI